MQSRIYPEESRISLSRLQTEENRDSYREVFNCSELILQKQSKTTGISTKEILGKEERVIGISTHLERSTRTNKCVGKRQLLMCDMFCETTRREMVSNSPHNWRGV